jgi:hypothetical protein
MLQGRKRRRAPGPEAAVCFGAGGGGVLQAKRSRSTACSGAGGGNVLWAKRSMLRVKRSMSRAKQSSGVEGEAVEATVYSVGEAVEGALRRSRHAPGIGGVEDLKRASGENLLSVEQAART